MGITVDPKEIDSKVATGPKKPSEGKTNKYRLKGKGGNLQIQVYNKGGSKPFELNMYKEENEMTKSLKDTIVEMWSEAVSPAQQAAIAIYKKEKGEEPKDEGNAFGAALKAAREKGDETFVVAGKTYKCEDYDEKGQVKEFVQADGVKRRVKEGDNRLKANRTETNKNNKSDDGDGLDAVQPKAVKKKFKDRIDKDIDNDGDVDDSDKFLHKRRKAVSKAIKSEEVELDENYRKLAMKGIGTETKKAAKVGLKTDYYLPKNGDKSFGKITRVTSSGYEITDEKTKEVHKFKFYDADNDPTSVRGIKSAYSESIQRYHETKKGSLRDTVLQMWGEISEKVEYVEYKFKSERDAKAAKQHLDGMKMMSFDINDDNIRGGELSVDAGKKDMTKAHKEIMQKFKPKVMKTEKNDLTKEKKNGTKNMTDTGKEVTPVEMSPKMPKIKETKNKV